ncbi:uncharacterized protein LOC127289741 isoform X2 [Leptopilina boulardi]|uniref:uncharacterized protein LOC127289741 isoform X2 n=1 Tax=Leptopilina boulardi TaxID=63433 RepID=UPI0021F5553B|nr:uncharacterized protein LOC127289741 isoform X2 [Leptopilina boulardi]
MRLSPIVISAATAWAGQTSGLQHHEQRRGVANGDYYYHHQQQKMAYFSGYRPELSTEFFLVPVNIGGDRVSGDRGDASVASVVSVPAPNHTISIYRGPGGHRSTSTIDTTKLNSATRLWPLIRPHPWALPLVAFSAVTMFLMASFEIFVLCKARTTAPSRRHLFLGQALLLGLFFLAGLSAAASITPNLLSCAAFRLVGLPAALVFAALLVKCVFLLSLNSGVYLPAPYQALVLIFAVLVQVAINAQWFYGEPPAVISNQNASRTSFGSACKTPVSHTLASLGYPSTLLVAVTCLAVRARGVRDNHREAAFIGLAVGLSLPTWIATAIGALTAPEDVREAWVAFGLLSTSFLVFLTMFLPKGRQLAALGRENSAAITAAMRDREEQLSCSSLPGSGYSPSFFHFKPADTSLKRKVDYHSTDVHGGMDPFVMSHGVYLRPEDVGNLYTTLSTNPNVFFQRAHPGMMY